MTTGSSKNTTAITAAIAGLTLLTFLADLFLHLGFGVPFIYTALVIIFLWMKKKQNVFVFAGLVSILTIIGFFLSPGETVNGEILNKVPAVFNRTITIVVTWFVAFLVSRYQVTAEVSIKKLHQFDALFTAATEGIVVTDAKGRIVMANPRSHEMFGYEKGTLIGRIVEDLVPNRYRAKHVSHRQNFHGDPHSRLMGAGRDLYGQKADGSEFPVEISLSFFRQDDKLYVISFIIDITYRKTAEKALLKANKNLEQFTEALQQSNTELEQFAYVASHDLQEPLRKIQAFGDRLRMKEEENISEESLDYLNRMLNAAGRMKDLINDLLTFSRVSTQAKPFQQLDLDRIVKEVLSDIEISIEKANATVEKEQLPTIQADPLQMRQLFQNLLSNALKFRRDSVPPRIRIHSEYTGEDKKEVKIYIEDNGIGFEEKYLDRIFNIFQRLEGKAYEGSGVGLAICRKIAQRHKGDITAKSTPGEGTTFIVTLPVEQ